MKSTLLLTLCLLLSLSFYAQEDEEPINETDTIEQEFKFEVSIGKRDFDPNQNLMTRWLSLGLGLNTVANNGNLNLPNQPQFLDDWNLKLANSTNVQLGIVSQQLNLVDHKFFLNYGLGLDLNKYSFENNFFIDTEANTWTTTAIPEETKKNRLAVKYLQIPVLLSFEGNGEKGNPLRFAAGGFGGMRIGSNQKVKYKENVAGSNKIKNKDDFNQNNFQYGLRTELGYSIANLYATYKLNDVFKEGIGTQELNGVNIGIMLLPF